MHHRRNTLLINLLFLFIFVESPIFITPVHAKPENLSALLQRWTPPEVKKSVKKSPKKKAAQVALGVEALPLEYWIYFEAKAALEKKLDLKSIESLEKRILEVRLNADTRALEKEFDELFYALEIKRAERQVRLKSWRLATRSFTHAMNALHTFKWIYYWRAETSDALVALCTRKAKVKDDACPVLAKRVVDAFPKSATETKVLRDLPAIEASPLVDVATADRLSRGRSEYIRSRRGKSP